MALPLAGAKILAADLAAIFPFGVDAYEPYTPTLTQNATVTKTNNQSRYTRAGRNIKGQAYLTVTGSGTASNVVLVGLPVPAINTALMVVGSGFVYDVSAGLFYSGTLVLNTDQTAKIAVTSAGNYVGGTAAAMSAALAAGDLVSVFFDYEAAS